MSLFNKNKHKHIWIAINLYTEQFDTGMKTDILYKCECKERKTQRFNGRWVKEDFDIKDSK